MLIPSNQFLKQRTPDNRLFLSYSLVLIFGMLIIPIPKGSAEIRSGTLSQDERWSLAQSPWLINGNLTIPAGVSLIIDPSVEIRIADNTVITVKGHLSAVGTESERIQFLPQNTNRWGALTFTEKGSGTLEYCSFSHGSGGNNGQDGMINAMSCTGGVYITHCSFSDWPDDFDHKAFYGLASNPVEIRFCWFGEGVNEGIYTEQTPILVEYNTFAHRYGYSDAVDVGYVRRPDPLPIIRKNVFLGSEDDAIDLDHVDAFIEGNWIFDCRGGTHDPIGISGDQADSRPMILNNVIINCESGIGFKNGADITVINNTIIDCDRGIWMHQNPSHAKVINTLIWGKADQTSIKLEPGSTIDISYSIIRGATVYAGEGNTNTPPRFVDADHQDYHLLSDSPAIDAGLGTPDVLNWDFDLQPRVDILSVPNRGKGSPDYVDIGAFEYQGDISGIIKWDVLDLRY